MNSPSAERIVGITAAAMVVAAPFAYTASRDVMGMEYAAFYWIAACGLLVATAIAARFRRKTALCITAADAIAAAYLTYCLANGVAKGGTDPLIIWRWGAVASGYIFARLLERRTLLMVGIEVSALVQTALAALQQAGMAASNHNLFAVTGSFGNPGQLGGFLAVGFAAALSLSAASNDKRAKRAHIAAATVIAAGLLLADSRAGFVGAAVAVAYILWHKIKAIIRKPIWAATAAVASAALVVALFAYRPGSASARLLIWRVTADMIADAPVTGHGTGAFNREYLEYQGRYFAAHHDSPFIMVADNAGYAYNEALHLTAEQGLVGLALAVLFMAVLFAHPQRTAAGGAARCGMAAWLGFAMFSYPASTIPTMLIFGMMAGTADSRTLFKFRVRPVLSAIAMAAAFTAATAAIHGLRFFRKCDEATFADAHFDRTRLNPRLCDGYIARLADSGQYRRITEVAGLAFPSTGTYCNIAAAYDKGGNPKQAEEYYLRAADMVPTRFMPRYMLWEMYVRHGDTARAAATARRLLAMPLKTENTFTLRKKAELREFLCRMDSTRARTDTLTAEPLSLP